MITRYLKPISVTGSTASDFIDAIASAFIDVGFTEVTPIYSSGSSYVKGVRFGNLEIDIYKSVAVITFQGYLHYNTESYYTLSTTLTVGGATPYGCNLCFFVSGDGKFIACNLASNTEQIGKGQGNFFNIITDNEEICGIIRYNSSSSLSTDFRSTNQYTVSLTPKRTYQKAENVFFKDEGVPVLKSSNSSYIMDLPYLTTLSGAERSYTYTMTNGENYYCLLDNIAVKFDATAS